MTWEDEFKGRMATFEKSHSSEGRSLSIKVRVSAGCFHREHSPRAYEIIDGALRATSRDFTFQEHESGPELLVWLALGTAGLTFLKSVVEMVTAIIRARAEGIKAGDHPREPLELIVRSMDEAGHVKEERILRIASDDAVTKAKVAAALEDAAKRFLPQGDPAGPQKPTSKKGRGR